MLRPRQEVGKRVSASIINQGVEARELLDSLTAAAPLEITTGENGIAIGFFGSLVGLELGVTTSTITTRSGTTLGSGTVTLKQATFSGSLVTSSVSQTVYNYSTSKSVPNSTGVIIAKIHGVYIVIWADCA